MKPAVAAFAEDHALIARFVDVWRNPPFKEGAPETPIAINDIAWELGIGQAKAAVTMKWAAQDGWVRRTNPRTEQAAYEPTEKALAQYPADGSQVMPDAGVEVRPGVFVRGESAEEARSWGDDPELVEVKPERVAALLDPKRPSELPPGES